MILEHLCKTKENNENQCRFVSELGRMRAKKEMLENLASGPFVGLCATFARRKR